MFALLCMGVCRVRGLEGEDVRRGVRCMCFTLMSYVVFMKRKNKKKHSIFHTFSIMPRTKNKKKRLSYEQ